MNSGHLIFDPTPSHHHHHNRGQMLFLGGAAANPIFQGMGMEDGSNKRPRPFFTSPDELIDEEYYDEQMPEKKRRLTPEQVHMLERSFEEENKLEPERKSELARKLGLQQRQVAVWFQNRRARWKTKQLERDFDRLKSSYDALLVDHDALRKENDRLRSQVTSLTEKLQANEPGAAVNTALNNKDNHVEEPVVAATTSVADNATVHVQQQPVEDRLSPGSGGSAVVDGETPQLVDSSGESYFQESYQGGCGIGIHSEEEDGSDDGCSYLPADVFAAAASHNSDGWWVWN